MLKDQHDAISHTGIFRDRTGSFLIPRGFIASVAEVTGGNPSDSLSILLFKQKSRFVHQTVYRQNSRGRVYWPQVKPLLTENPLHGGI